jgi:hypothetical protein
LVSSCAPWSELFAALDAAGEDFAGEPVAVEDEAAAIVACCLRYGTYFHVLTGGEYFPDFARDDGLSRVSDDEMKRINIEFSSALAEWWGERGADPSKIWRRTRAALSLLPINWAVDPFVIEARAEVLGEFLNKVAMDPSISSMKEATHRQEANHSVVRAYRNGLVEGLHAGTWSLGREIPGYVRLYADEARRICSAASEVLGGIIIVRDSENLGRVFRQVSSVAAPSSWALTDETASVRFHGMTGYGPLDDRLRVLSEKAPRLFRAQAPAGTARGMNVKNVPT